MYAGRWLVAHRRDGLVMLWLLMVAAAPRLFDLGSFLTADEKNWIGRSSEFVRAFRDFRFNDMLQTTHPGVTTLWLSGAAVAARTWQTSVPFSFDSLRHFVAASQLSVALALTLLVPVFYWLLRRLTDDWPLAALAATLIALDPLLIGHARVVHVDGLLAGLLFAASLLLLLAARRGWDRRWLLAAGVTSGLALLTKAPAVFILPYFGLLVLVVERSRLFFWPVLRARLSDAGLWVVAATLTFVLLWPAVLWVPDPQGNVLLIKRDLSHAVVTPHHMSETYRLDAFFYPVTLLTRTTPWVQVLVLVALLAVSLATVHSRVAVTAPAARRGRVLMGWLAAYVFFFMVMMTLGAKKGDRYLLPVFPALDVVAAIGLVTAVRAMPNWRFRVGKFQMSLRRVGAWLAVGLVVGLAGVTVYRYHPYAIAYRNPLFPDNLAEEFGWGEGLEQVGAWLDKRAPTTAVASWYPEELRAYTVARVAHLNAHEQYQVRYVVLYRNMFGRAPDHPANDFIDEYYRKREAVFVAHVAGKPFAWVYEKPVFERVVGELVPGVAVGQAAAPAAEVPLSGVDVLVATYLGRARSGELVVRLRRSAAGEVLFEWRVPVAQLTDNGWARFQLPRPLEHVRAAWVEIQAEGTRQGEAPTVRWSTASDVRPSSAVSSAGALAGDLAFRLRYQADGQEIVEGEDKLLAQQRGRTVD